MVYVKLENSVVIQKQPYAEPGFIEAPDSVVCGMILENGEYVNPPPPAPEVPQSVTMRQARLVLLGAGMLPQVEATIAALPEPDRTAATIEWEYSQEVQRHNGFVAMLGPMLGLDDEQLDALFIQAATL